MEPLRSFIVSEVQQALRRKFEGQPVTPWENSYGHSLPPAPETPKPPTQSRTRMPPELKAEVCRRLENGESPSGIARSVGLRPQRVFDVKSRMNKRASAHQPAPAPVAAPTVLPASPEGQRLHVLNWGRKMAAYEYSVAPKGVVPRKRKRAIRAVPPLMVDRKMYTPTIGMTINPRRTDVRAPARGARAINCAAAPPTEIPSPPAKAQKEAKRAEFESFFVGGRSPEVEVELSTGEQLC